MSIRLDDFVGFEWNGHHSSEFNLKVVSNGNRYDSRFLSDITNNTVDIPGQDGQYFYNSTYGPKKWTINIAFDNVTETMQREIENWLSSKELSDLTFDERPYKSYSAKLESRPSITWICFDEPKKTHSCSAPRIYKGEGTLNFVAPFPYAYSVINNNEYMKFIDQFEFKKNTYIPPTEKIIQITDNAGGYINKEHSQVLELKNINITPMLLFNQEENSYFFNKYILKSGQSLQFAQGKKRINFFNNGENDLIFQNCNGIKDCIEYDQSEQKYYFINKTLSKTAIFEEGQNRYFINFTEDEQVLWNENNDNNIMCAYRINEIDNPVNYSVSYFKDSNYVQRIAIEFLLPFFEKTEIEFLFTIEPKNSFYFSNKQLTYNLKSNEGISLVYIKNENNENGIVKELVFNCYETLYYNLSEWLASSHLINNSTEEPYDYCKQKGKAYVYPVVNSGDLETPFEITIPLSNKNIKDKEIIIALTEDDVLDQNFEQSVTNYFDFNTSDIYYLKENNKTQEYYLLNKRIENSQFKLYFCNEDNEEIKTLTSSNGFFNNLYKINHFNNSIIKSFTLKFDSNLSKEYYSILQNFASNNKLIINTYKQTIELSINDNGNEILIPMHFLLSRGDLFKIPVGKFKLSNEGNIKLDKYKILVYDNNSIIDKKITEEKLKYRFLYY